MLFKVEGQNITNQRTEPHKSLISKNVSKMKTLCDCLDIFFQSLICEASKVFVDSYYLPVSRL